MAKKPQFVPDDQVLDNQARAKALGVNIPGLSSTSAPAASSFSMPVTQDDKSAQAARDNLLRINNADATARVSGDREYRDSLKRYQAQIDSTNAIYNDMLNKARIEGQGRLGSNRAADARGGLLGSDFATAHTKGVMDENAADEGAVENERSLALAAIMGQARKDASESVAAKLAARKSGAEAVAKYYTEEVPKQKAARASKVAKALYAKKLDPSTLSPSELKTLTGEWNVSVDDLSEAYATEQADADATARETEKEQSALDVSDAQIRKIDADIAKGKLIELSEGAMLFNPETGETFKNPKTYAPKDGPVNGLPGNVPEDIKAAAQSILDGKSKLNEYPSKTRLAINQHMSSLYKAEGGDQLAQGAYDAIVNLETHPGFKGATGAKGPSSLFGALSKPIGGTNAAGFSAKLDSLKANIKLVNIKYLKGTGALSDAEGKTLEDAGTSLNTDLPEGDFTEELARVKKALLKASNVQQNTEPTVQIAPDGTEVIIVD